MIGSEHQPVPVDSEDSMVSPLLVRDCTAVVLESVLVLPADPGETTGAKSSQVTCMLTANASVTSMASSCRSDTNSSTVGPTCRICDYPGELANQLISPCRCSGTSKFVHEQCLNKWLETIKSHSSPHCEVCRYHIRTHKRYRINDWHFPDVSPRDKFLHLIFLISLLVLIICAVTNIIGIVTDTKTHSPQDPQTKVTMTTIEGVTLVSGLLFFVAFVVALITQIKAKDNMYHLILQCFATNTEWRIDNYKRSCDSLYIK